jgi:ubiquinol-cytochrome c reductase cytochrome c1 subunit
MIKNVFIALVLALASASVFAASEVELDISGADIGDKGSLQRGAGYFMNYCAGCHSLTYQRYSRIAEDLELTEDQVMKNLAIGDAKFGDVIKSPLSAKDGEKWLGKAPPDLTLVARTKKGEADWVYSFLTGYYQDDTATGWNNRMLPGTAMPNPLWDLQGIQSVITEPKVKDAHGEAHCAKGEYKGECIKGFQVADHQKGRMDAKQFNQVARDISAFLQYTAEPAALKREALGVWVILFLSIFTLLAYALKTEFWRDVH